MVLPAETVAVARRYLEHLGDGDLQRLASAARVPLRPDALRAEPARVLELLELPATHDALLADRPDPGGYGQRLELALASPFLVFAVAVHRAVAEVLRTGRMPEWTGPRQRLPLFLAPPTRDFLAAPASRLFLAELLASFARVASGSYLTRGAGGWRRRRWSELDPVRLAGLLEAVPVAERPGVYRRLGDVALFLSGVFPDWLALHGLGLVDAERLLRAVGVRPETAPASPVALYEHLGASWYRRASTTATAPTAQTLELTGVADSFADARRVLTLVADRYLFPVGWGEPSAS